MDFLRVSEDEVRRNVRNFLGPASRAARGARFVKGFFNDTVPTIPGDAVFSVLRLDGDMFSSYLDCLFGLYDKLSVGGYVICDDCFIQEAMAAVLTFRAMHGIDRRGTQPRLSQRAREGLRLDAR